MIRWKHTLFKIKRFLTRSEKINPAYFGGMIGLLGKVNPSLRAFTAKIKDGNYIYSFYLDEPVSKELSDEMDNIVRSAFPLDLFYQARVEYINASSPLPPKEYYIYLRQEEGNFSSEIRAKRKPKCKKCDFGSKLLVLNWALLGRIPPKLQMITMDGHEPFIKLHFHYTPFIQEKEQYIAEEIIADIKERLPSIDVFYKIHEMKNPYEPQGVCPVVIFQRKATLPEYYMDRMSAAIIDLNAALIGEVIPSLRAVTLQAEKHEVTPRFITKADLAKEWREDIFRVKNQPDLFQVKNITWVYSFYFDESIADELWDGMDCLVTEAFNFLDCFSQTRVEQICAPLSLPERETYVYLREEEGDFAVQIQKKKKPKNLVFFPGSAILAVNWALLGRVTPKLQRIAMERFHTHLKLHFYYHPPLDEEVLQKTKAIVADAVSCFSNIECSYEIHEFDKLTISIDDHAILLFSQNLDTSPKSKMNLLSMDS